jgi:hypothetical protein
VDEARCYGNRDKAARTSLQGLKPGFLWRSMSRLKPRPTKTLSGGESRAVSLPSTFLRRDDINRDLQDTELVKAARLPSFVRASRKATLRGQTFRAAVNRGRLASFDVLTAGRDSAQDCGGVLRLAGINSPEAAPRRRLQLAHSPCEHCSLGQSNSQRAMSSGTLPIQGLLICAQIRPKKLA